MRAWLAGVACVVGFVFGIGCEDFLECGSAQCSESRFVVRATGTDVELRAGAWVVTAEIEDGVYVAACDVNDSDSDCEGAWTTEPTRDLESLIFVTNTFVEAGELVPAEMQLTVLHAEMGPESVRLTIEIDGDVAQTQDITPDYKPHEINGPGCGECPPIAFANLTIES